MEVHLRVFFLGDGGDEIQVIGYIYITFINWEVSNRLEELKFISIITKSKSIICMKRVKYFI